MPVRAMNRFRRCALTIGSVAFALNSACYAYQPVTGIPLAESQRVRLHLTTEGTAELARLLGPRVEAASGTLTRIQPSGELGEFNRSSQHPCIEVSDDKDRSAEVGPEYPPALAVPRSAAGWST